MRLIAGLIVLLTCAACTIGPTQPQSSTTEAPTTAAAAPTTEAPRPTPTELPVLASRTTSYSSASATVAVNQLVVSGGVSTLTWTLTNTSDDGLIVTTILGDGIFTDGQGATVPGSSTGVPGDRGASDGVYLIDAVNKQRYLPARDSQGVCVCTVLDTNVTLQPGGSKVFSATFKAVPGGVATVGVSIPGAGTFTDVPVQR